MNLRKAHPRVVAIFSLLLAVGFVGCAAKKKTVTFHGPGHDADWPIEAPNSEVYSAYTKAQRLSFYGKIDDSIAAYKQALELDPKSYQIHLAIAYEYTRKGDMIKAEDEVKKAIAIKDNSKDAYFLLGKIHVAEQHWGEGEKAYKKAIELDTDDQEEAVVSLASLYVDSKQFTQAVDLLEKYTKENPTSLYGFYYLGRVYSELNRNEDALKAYDKSIALHPGFVAAIKASALIYEQQGKKAEAKKMFERVLELQPDNLGVRNHLSQLYLDDKEFEDARRELEHVVAEQPENLTARLRLGLLYLQKNDLVQAEGILKALLKDAPQKDRVYYYLGVIAEKKGDTKEALNDFSKIDVNSDSYVEARLAASYLHEQKGNIKEAEKVLRQAVAAKPDEHQLLTALAGVLAKNGKGDEAVNMLKTRIEKIKPKKDETLWFALGEVYDKLHNFSKLDESMHRVLEINPDNASALNYLGYTYAEKGVFLAEAEKMIRRALEIRPKDGYITDSLGWVLYKQGKFADSVKTLEDANRLAPGETTLLEHLADALVKLGKKDDAHKNYEKALKVGKDEAEKARIREKIKKSLGK